MDNFTEEYEENKEPIIITIADVIAHLQQLDLSCRVILDKNGWWMDTKEENLDFVFEICEHNGQKYICING